MKAKINLKNVIAYCQGNIRYRLYYSKFNWLIPNHVIEQIKARIFSMNLECYNSGSCNLCGCRTTHLQMANKPCEGNCYPKMLNRKDWLFLETYGFKEIDNVIWELEGFQFKKEKDAI